MYEITGDKAEVLKLLDDTIRALQEGAPKTRTAAARGLARKGVKPTKSKTDELAAALRRARDRQKPQRGTARATGVRATAAPVLAAVQRPYAPRDREIALVQSAMDQYLEEKFGPS